MDTRIYSLTFATRSQANAYAAQERQRYPADLYETDLVVAPVTNRPFSFGVPYALQEEMCGAHQWSVNGSRLITPRAR